MSRCILSWFSIAYAFLEVVHHSAYFICLSHPASVLSTLVSSPSLSFLGLSFPRTSQHLFPYLQTLLHTEYHPHSVTIPPLPSTPHSVSIPPSSFPNQIPSFVPSASAINSPHLSHTTSLCQVHCVLVLVLLT